MLKLLVFVLLVICTGRVEGQLIIAGCASKWLTLKCPGDDTLSIKEARIEHSDKPSSPCYQSTPVGAKVPPDLAHLCPTPNTCIYTSDICEGKNECAFYISPHVVATVVSSEVKPTLNSEVIITYECKFGPGKTARIVVLSLLAIIFCLIVVGVLFYIYRKNNKSFGAGGFNKFDDDTSSVASVPTSTRRSGSASMQYSSKTEEIKMESST